VLPIDTEQVLSRVRAQIGDAAVKTSSIHTNGSLVESDLRDVCYRYFAFFCRAAARFGLRREMLFAMASAGRTASCFTMCP
jgi:hypothetical protein